MAGISGEIKVEGARQLRATLRKAGDDLSDLKDTHARAAEIAANRTKTDAPHQTGKLAATVRSAGTKTAGIVRVGTARVPYANPIHWGWGRRHIAANPFVSRAARETEPVWIEVYWAEINHSLDKIQGV